MPYYLIEFHSSMITNSQSSNNLYEIEDKFEEYISNTHLGDAYEKARQIYELRDKKELSEEEQELMNEKSLIMTQLFDPCYSGYDAEYIECNDGYIYYVNTVDNIGLLLGGVEGHFIQVLSEECN